MNSMNEQPLWSVIIIGYNEAEHLPRTIASALDAARKVESAEVIFVDCDSTDDSIRVASELGITVVALKPRRRTASVARNAGAAVSRGQYIQFLDGDIALDAQWLASAQDIFDELPDIAMVCGQLVELEHSGNVFVQYHATYANKRTGTLTEPTGGGGAITREAFEAIGGYNANMLRGEETEFAQRFRDTGRIIYGIDATMGYHRIGFHSAMGFIRRCIHMGKSYAFDILDPLTSTRAPFRAMAWRNVMLELFLLVSIMIVMTAVSEPLYLLGIAAACAITWISIPRFTRAFLAEKFIVVNAVSWYLLRFLIPFTRPLNDPEDLTFETFRAKTPAQNPKN